MPLSSHLWGTTIRNIRSRLARQKCQTLKKISKAKRIGDMAHNKYLPSKHKTLSSNTSPENSNNHNKRN
jgi:hypothetical protein